MARLTSVVKPLLLICGLAVSVGCDANTLEPISWSISLNYTAHPELESVTTESLYSARALLEVNVLDRWGGGLGTINEHRTLSTNENLSNSLSVLQLWWRWHPDYLRGSLRTALNVYHGSGRKFLFLESTNASAVRRPDGRSGLSDDNVQIVEETLTAVNPVVAFTNQDKTWYADLSFSRMELDTKEAILSDLVVAQFSPALGFSLGESHDWIYFRYFYNSLSNVDRNPGVESTQAVAVTWTRWLQPEHKPGFESLLLGVLVGERIYGVEQDVPVIYSSADLQTGSIFSGVKGWVSRAVQMAVLAGVERFKDAGTEESYEDIFLSIDAVFHW